MAEQALVAQLRVDLSKFDADLRKATQNAEHATKGISDALARVENAVKPLPQQFNRMGNELQKTSRDMDTAAKTTAKFNSALNSMKSALGAFGIAVTAQQVVQFALDMGKAAEAMTGVQQQLVRVTGSTQAAAKEMAFIREETHRLALSTVDGAKGYARLANAAQGTSLAGEGVRQVFSALNTITRANRLSQEEYGRVLNQVTQIISKGRIQTEELITLAESGIPAFTLLGQSMGVTGTQLGEMLQKGQVPAEALILLAGKLQSEFGALAEQAAQTMPAKFARGWNQVKLEVIDAAQGILESGELINAFEFKSNMLDIFPSKEDITANVDYIVRQFKALSLIVQGIFEMVRDKVVSVFTGIVERIKAILAPLINFAQNIPGFETIKQIGQAAVGMVGPFKSITASTMEAKEETEEWQGLIFKMFGIEGQTAVERWNKLVGKGLEVTGKKMPAAVDSKKMVKESKDAEDKITKLREQALKDVQRFTEKTRKDTAQKDIVTEEDAAKTIASMRKRVTRQQLDEEERQLASAKKKQFELEKKHAETVAEMNSRIQRQASEDAAAVEAAVERSKATGIPVLEPLELTKQEQLQAEATEKIFENMRENIQRSLANTISDILRRDIDNVKDVGTSLGTAFVDTFINMASESLSAWAMSALDAPMKKLQDSLSGAVPSGQAGGAAGGQMGAGGMAMTAIGGMAGGAALGMGVSEMAGGGKTGGMLGGAMGGMMAGAMIGMLAGPVGAAIGAAAGAIIGGIMGGFMSKDKEKTSLITQTGTGVPGSGPSARSPFGIVSMFEDSKASAEVMSAATLAISEIDTAIAGHLDERQRTIVQDYFQSAIPEGSFVQSAEVDDAIAKAVQLRLYHAITAISDEATAKNVVGEAFSATAGNIAQIQQRAMEALGILKMIEEFKVGPLSATAEAIKNINTEFQALADQATSLGLSTDEIVAEQQRRIAEVATSVNEQTANETMAILDPVGHQFKLLAEEERKRVQEAMDAGADVAAVQELYALKRLELEKKLGEDLNAVTTAAHQQQVNAARAGIVGAIYAITDPFAAAMHQINQQIIAFEEQVAQGLIPQHLVDQYARAAVEQAQQQEAERQKQEQEQRRAQAEAEQQARQQEQERRINAQRNFMLAFNEMNNPMAAAMQRVNDQIREFQQLVEDGIIPQAAYESFRRLALGQAEVDRALQALSGGPSGGLEQIGSAFRDFIKAGNPMSQSQQAMQALTDQMFNLTAAADILGLSTADLERSYMAQAKAIREQAIAAIDQQLEPRRQALGGIDKFLEQQRLDPQLPASMQLTEARAQLKSRISEGDVQGAVQAAETFQNLARQSFGGTETFFGVQKDINNLLSVMREREAANIERERERLIRNEERQMQQIEIGRNSIDYLRRISSDNSATSRGIDQLIAIGQRQAEQNETTRQLLARLVVKTKA